MTAVLTTLFGFDGANGDGAFPSGSLVEDANGNLFGTTIDGGTNNQGTVFELVNNNGTYTLNTLVSLSSNDGTGE